MSCITRDRFLALVPVESITAVDLYNHVKTVFNETDIPFLKNIVGIAADGVSVMMGIKKNYYQVS